MSTATNSGGPTGDVQVVTAAVHEGVWPVDTKWRAVLGIQGEFRSPEWVLSRVKAVPLSSRAERALLTAVSHDNGRDVLEMAATPGEHHLAAAVIASLRIAGTYPERALRFLEWIRTSPTDPSQLRFLRRYLPGLEVLTEIAPGVPVAMPINMDALTFLQSELLRTASGAAAAEAVLIDLAPSAAKAVAISSLRLDQGDAQGALSYCQDRPMHDSLTGALAVQCGRAQMMLQDPGAALTTANRILSLDDLAKSVELEALQVRAEAQRGLGLHTEAELTEAEVAGNRTDAHQAAAAPAGPARPPVEPPQPGGQGAPHASAPEPRAPLFGRDLADALDDAWARVRRQTVAGPDELAPTAAETEALVQDVIELIGREQYDAAESLLLSSMDRFDAAVDRGEDFDDTCFVLLAGMFDKRNMPPEEVATLERLRATYVRSGKELPEGVSSRLLARRSMLDSLARDAG